MSDALKPSPRLLCKLASVLVHVDEMRESKHDSNARYFDEIALNSTLDDREVKEWVEAMTKMAMAPIKRSRPAVVPKLDLPPKPWPEDEYDASKDHVFKAKSLDQLCEVCGHTFDGYPHTEPKDVAYRPVKAGGQPKEVGGRKIPKPLKK